MTKWYDDLKARKVKGAGSVEVLFDGDDKPTIVPLRHPLGKDKAQCMSVIESVGTGEEMTASDASVSNDRIMLAMLQACIDGELPDDDTLIILGNESGGLSGKLMQRCARLIGMHHLVDDEVKTDVRKRRGR